MKILLYNFVQPEEFGAGGVGVYINNLAKALERDHEVILLSSGDRYSPRRREPRVEFSRDHYHRAIIINSPVIAPAGYSFGDPETYSNSTDLDFVPRLLSDRYGTIDVFHFQNIEGLTASFFRTLREQFPAAKIIYSVHNYHPICPRFTLWYQDRTLCTDYREGVACTTCGVPIFDPNFVRAKRRLIWLEKAHPRLMALVSPVTALAKTVRGILIRARTRNKPDANPAGNSLRPAPADAYAAFRRGNIELFTSVFDRVLAVSERTRRVILDRGVPAEVVDVSYIGTAYKQTYLTSSKIRDLTGGLHLGYIGYMGRDKGFPFLLECLELLPDAIAADTVVTIAARNTFPELHAQMQAVGKRFKRLRYFDGYTHANLGEVLDGVNLGMIPVLWEDNLPQTAIELVARGIPLLTSDRGGAQEIASKADFTFAAGNHEAFVDAVVRIARGEIDLGSFWEGNKRIYSMDEHLDDLMTHYRPAPDRENLPAPRASRAGTAVSRAGSAG